MGNADHCPLVAQPLDGFLRRKSGGDPFVQEVAQKLPAISHNLLADDYPLRRKALDLEGPVDRVVIGDGDPVDPASPTDFQHLRWKHQAVLRTVSVAVEFDGYERQDASSRLQNTEQKTQDTRHKTQDRERW